MLPFRLFIQDNNPNHPSPFLVSQQTFVDELLAGNFEDVAIFEMVSEPFALAMQEYVRKAREGTDQPVTVVVLIEAKKDDGGF